VVYWGRIKSAGWGQSGGVISSVATLPVVAGRVAEGPAVGHLDQAVRVDLAGADLESPPTLAERNCRPQLWQAISARSARLVLHAEHGVKGAKRGTPWWVHASGWRPAASRMLR
jgi:hypothetical protein